MNVTLCKIYREESLTFKYNFFKVAAFNMSSIGDQNIYFYVKGLTNYIYITSIYLLCIFQVTNTCFQNLIYYNISHFRTGFLDFNRLFFKFINYGMYL